MHHTASSRRSSPSPWRRKRRSSFASNENIFTRKFWLLPLWSWIAIAAVVIAAIVLLAVFGLPTSDPANSNVPPANDATAADGAQPSADETPEIYTDIDVNAEALPTEPAQNAPAAKETGVIANDFMVSFEWAMNYMRYGAPISLVSEETGSGGEKVRTYSYEDWLSFSLALNPETNVIRTVTATANASNGSRVVTAFVCMLYGIDNSMDANTCASRINSLLSDPSKPFTKSAYTVTLEVPETPEATAAPEGEADAEPTAEVDPGEFILTIAGRQ